MYADIAFGGSPLLPAPTAPAAPSTDTIDTVEQDTTIETSSNRTSIRTTITNTVVQLWNTGIVQRTSRWALRLLVVWLVVGMACAAALLVHGLPRAAVVVVNTVSFSWWLAQLATLVTVQMWVACGAPMSYSCKRRPRLLQVHPTTPWFNTTNLQALWTRTAWMV